MTQDDGRRRRAMLVGRAPRRIRPVSGRVIAAVVLLLASCVGFTATLNRGEVDGPDTSVLGRSAERRPPYVDAGGLDLKALVIASSKTEQEYLAATGALDQTGVPHDDFIVGEEHLTGAELAKKLSGREGHANYNAIVVTTGNIVAPEAQQGNDSARLTDDQRRALEDFEAEFKVRSVTLNTFPDPAFGLRYVSYAPDAGAALVATATEAGRSVFPYLAASGEVSIRRTGVYLADVDDPASTTPLLTVRGADGRTHPVVSVHRAADGQENLAITAGNGPEMVHSLVLSYGWIEWVTRGVHLGNRQPSLDLQVDDLFLTVALWDPAKNEVGAGKFRNSGVDMDALATWLGSRRAKPTTPDLTVDFAFVGSGTEKDRYPDDTLVPAVRRHADDLRFINHTYSHYDMDCGARASCGGAFQATEADIQREIRQNISRAKELGLTSDWDTMVQPDVSGVNNTPGSVAQGAAADAGVRYWISDTSRDIGKNPSFNVGIQPTGDKRMYVVPRHPTNLFYDNSTPKEWVDEYNHSYGPGGRLCDLTNCFTEPQSYEQILDRESDVMLRYLLTGDNNPLMFHTPNVRAYDGQRSLLSDLVDATLDKYDALVTFPIASPSFRQIGMAQKARGVYDDAAVAATVVPCRHVVVRSEATATAHVQGAGVVTGDDPAASRQSTVKIRPTTPVTLPVTPC